MTQKGQGLTSLCLGPNISETVVDRDSGEMDHQLEMTDWDSNGHVTYDVTLPGKVKVMTPVYLGSIISTTVGDTDLVPIKHLLKMTT